MPSVSRIDEREALQVETLTTEPEFVALAEQWSAVAERVLRPSVFLTPEWFQAAWAWRRHDSRSAYPHGACARCPRRHPAPYQNAGAQRHRATVGTADGARYADLRSCRDAFAPRRRLRSIRKCAGTIRRLGRTGMQLRGTRRRTGHRTAARTRALAPARPRRGS